MRVLVFGSYDKVAHPRVAVIIEGLRAHGFEVSECNAPLGLDTTDRVALLRRPWRAPVFVLHLLRSWITLTVRARRMPRPDVVLVAYLGHFDIHLGRLLFRGVPLVLDHFVSGSDTAKDRGVSGPLRDLLLRAVDTAALRAATLVVTDTDEHLRLAPEWAQPRGVVVPIGAPDEWQAPDRPAYDGSRPLRVIFFGLFTPLQGPLTIGAALRLLAGEPGLEVTMAGDGQDLAATRRLAGDAPNVSWLGMVPPEQMPALVAEHDVCLGIFGTTPKGLRVVPNKAYQGIRAGCALVTGDTAPQRDLLGDVAWFVPPGDPEALAGALRRFVTDPALVSRLQAASRAAAHRFAPEGVVTSLVAALRARG